MIMSSLIEIKDMFISYLLVSFVVELALVSEQQFVVRLWLAKFADLVRFATSKIM